MTDKKRAIINVTISIFFKIVVFACSFFVRRVLILTLGNEINGINSLFTSIVGVLSIAELGIGTAITYCMYKPIVDNDTKKIASLYRLFKRLYLVIAAVVLISGFVLSFFLPFLAKDYTISNQELMVCFYLFLLSSALTYLYGADSSLIIAYKNNFVSTIIVSSITVVEYALQIIALLVFKSFYLFLGSKIISALIQFTSFKIYLRRKYNVVLSEEKTPLESEDKKEVKKNIYALCLHKITGMIFFSIDNLVISALFGVVMLGKYSNYFLILNSMNEVLKLVFISITSIIGHQIIKKSKEQAKKYYTFLNNVNVILGFVFYLGYYAIVSELVTLFFGNDLELSKWLIILLTSTYFIQFLRHACETFKDSAGLFYKDRFVSLIASALNIGLSIGLSYLIGINGVVVATLIIVVLIYLPVDSFITYKYVFSKSFIKDILYKSIVSIVFIGSVFLMDFIKFNFESLVLTVLINGFVSIGISLICVVLLQLPWIKFDLKSIACLFFKKGAFDQIEEPVLFKKKSI